MYTITPQWHLQRHPHRLAHAALHPRPAAADTAAAATTRSRLNPNITNVERSNVPMQPPPLVATTSKSTVEDYTSLRSTRSHRAWVAVGCTSVLVSLAKSFAAAAATESPGSSLLEPLLAALLGYVLADLGSGVYHWAVDNYGGSSTPVFGPQIEAFRGHHRRPRTITRRQFANNLHASARAVALAVLPLDLLLPPDHAAAHAFVGACAGCVMFSQQFHAWAHGARSRLPPPVAALQDVGVIISRRAHAAHHRPPYGDKYCIVSGVWNDFLDGHRVFEAMEMVIYFRFGVRPRSWGEPELEWVEDVAGDDTGGSL